MPKHEETGEDTLHVCIHENDWGAMKTKATILLALLATFIVVVLGVYRDTSSAVGALRGEVGQVKTDLSGEMAGLRADIRVMAAAQGISLESGRKYGITTGTRR